MNKDNIIITSLKIIKNKDKPYITLNELGCITDLHIYKRYLEVEFEYNNAFIRYKIPTDKETVSLDEIENYVKDTIVETFSQ